MLLTFGSVSSLAILLVVIVSIIATVTIGDSITENMEREAYSFMGATSRHAAEVLSPKLMPNDLVMLMYEVS